MDRDDIIDVVIEDVDKTTEESQKDTISHEEILTYGNEPLKKIKDLSSTISREFDAREQPTEFMARLNKILNKIDYDELKLHNEKAKNNKGFMKFFNAVSKKTEKLMTKYTDIVGEFDAMDNELVDWRLKLNKNNVMFGDMADSLKDAKSEIQTYIEKGDVIASKMSESSPIEVERKRIMLSRIQDLHHALGVCAQMEGSIAVASRTNYNICNRIVSVSDKTLPMLQAQITILQYMKEQNGMLETLEMINQSQNQIMQFSSTETVRLSEKSVDTLSHNAEDYKVINESINTLRQGAKRIAMLETTKMQEAQHQIDMLCIEKGDDY